MSDHTYITYSEITGQKLCEEEFNSLIASFNKEATFRLLTMINNFLALFPFNFDKEKYVYIQGFLAHNLFDTETYEKLRNFVEDVSLIDRPIFHRQQVLLLMKKVLLTSSQNGGLNPEDSRESKNIVGKLLLISSDFTITFEQEQKTKSKDPLSKEESERILSELLVQMIPVQELFNPPEISASIVRTREYIKILNADYSETFEGKTLSAYFESLAGISLERFLQMIFGVYGSLIIKELNDLIYKPENFNIRKSDYFQHLKYNKEEVESFFSLTSIKFEDLCSELEKSPLKTLLQLQYDFTIFRKYPLFHLSADILTFTDFTFLIEKASIGLYYTILNSLQKNEINPETFFQTWGYIFERYVNNIFREIYPEFSNRFHPNTYYESKQKIEAFDGIIEYPDSLVVMQYKGGLLNTKAKYSGSVNLLLDELNDKYGTKKNKSAIKQLTKNIERLFNSEIGKRLKLRNLDFPNTRFIYPVLIVNELSLAFGLAHWQLKLWFEMELETINLTEDLSVKPLMILTIEDLEMITPYLEAADFTLLEFTEFYSSLEYIKFSRFLIEEHWYEPMTSMEEVFYKFRKNKGIPFRANQKIQGKFDNFMSEIMNQFKSELF